MQEKIFTDINKFLNTVSDSGLWDGLMYNINYGIFTLGIISTLITIIVGGLCISFIFGHFSKPKNYRDRHNFLNIFKSLGMVIVAVTIAGSSYLWLSYCIKTDRTIIEANCNKAYKFRDLLANDEQAKELMKTNSKLKGYEDRLINYTSKKCEGSDKKMYFKFGNVIFGS